MKRNDLTRLTWWMWQRKLNCMGIASGKLLKHGLLQKVNRSVHITSSGHWLLGNKFMFYADHMALVYLVKNKEVRSKGDMKTRLLRILSPFHYHIHTLTITTYIVKADRQPSTEQDLTTKSFWLSLLTTSLFCYCPKKLRTLLWRRLSSWLSSSGSVKSSEFDLSLTTQVGPEVIYHMFQTDHLISQDHIREFLIVLGLFSSHMLFLFTAHLLITIDMTWASNQLSVEFDTLLGLAQQQPHHLMDVL
jgi:hypothetical protein